MIRNLCGYYLDCLSHDDLEGVSESAGSKSGIPNYCELTTLPVFGENDPFDSEAGRQLLKRVRLDLHRQVIFLGYPVRLSLSRKVEPIFLFLFRDPESRYGKPALGEDPPLINFKALRSLSYTSEMGIVQEAIGLAEDLGLGNAPGDQPDLGELVARLRKVRADWDWQEEPDPDRLTTGESLAHV